MSRYIEYLMKVGRVGRDPELKHRPNGQAIANFSVTSHVGRVRFGSAGVTSNQDEKTFGVNQNISDEIEVNQDISDEIIVVGKLAEICAKHVAKGAENIHSRPAANVQECRWRARRRYFCPGYTFRWDTPGSRER